MPLSGGRPTGNAGFGYNARELRGIEEQTEALYTVFNPEAISDRFYLPMRHLPYDFSDPLKQSVMESMDFSGAMDKYGQHFRPIDEGPRGYSAFMLPRSEFMGGRASPEKLGISMMNWQADSSLDPTDLNRFSPSGRIPRQDVIERAANQINAFANPKKASNILMAKRLVLDVESAGLEPEKGIWQVSARMMEGGKETGRTNLFFRNKMMDMGTYSPVDQFGKSPGFEEFIKGLRGGGIEFIADDQAPGRAFSEGIRPFLSMVRDLGDEGYIVGQNIGFDINMLEHALKAPSQFQEGGEYTDMVNQFMRKAQSDKVIDTMLLAKATLGDIGVEPGLTPHSMENILLQSSLIEDVEARLRAQFPSGAQDYTDDFVRSLDQSVLESRYGGDRIRAAIYGRIETGMHFADIDTFFESHLLDLEVEALQGRDVLRAQPVADEAVKTAIKEAQSITPFTRIKALGGLTPILYGIAQTRKFELPSGSTPMEKQIFQAGIYSNWADKFLSRGGTILKDEYFGKGFTQVQEAATRAGLPFAGLSSFERAISTLMGQQTVRGGGSALSGIRQLAGDVSGAALWRETTQVRAFPRGNVAIPLELLELAQKEKVIKGKFTEALGDEVSGLQFARLSPFESFTEVDGKYQRRQDIALVADVFDKDNKVEGFIDFLKRQATEHPEAERLGLTDSTTIESVEKNLRRFGQGGRSAQEGIQIATMGGGSGDETARRIVNFMKQVGIDVDESSPIKLRAAIFKSHGALHSSPVMAELAKEAGQSSLASHGDEILASTRQTKELLDYTYGDFAQNRRLQNIVSMTKRTGKRAIYDKLDLIEKVFRRSPLVGAGVGAGLAAYYMNKKRKEQAVFDVSIEEQPFEEPGYYQRYQREMGAPEREPMIRLPHPLATANLNRQLEYDKTRHHQMGSNNKYNHLYNL